MIRHEQNCRGKGMLAAQRTAHCPLRESVIGYKQLRSTGEPDAGAAHGAPGGHAIRDSLSSRWDMNRVAVTAVDRVAEVAR
jgi:hypothetical protein